MAYAGCHAFPVPKMHCPLRKPLLGRTSFPQPQAGPYPPGVVQLSACTIPCSDSGPHLPANTTLPELSRGDEQRLPSIAPVGCASHRPELLNHFSGNKFLTEFPCSTSVFKALLLAQNILFSQDHKSNACSLYRIWKLQKGSF